jgi:hypothetical protein
MEYINPECEAMIYRAFLPLLIAADPALENSEGLPVLYFKPLLGNILEPNRLILDIVLPRLEALVKDRGKTSGAEYRKIFAFNQLQRQTASIDEATTGVEAISGLCAELHRHSIKLDRPWPSFIEEHEQLVENSKKTGNHIVPQVYPKHVIHFQAYVDEALYPLWSGTTAASQMWNDFDHLKESRNWVENSFKDLTKTLLTSVDKRETSPRTLKYTEAKLSLLVKALLKTDELDLFIRKNETISMLGNF